MTQPAEIPNKAEAFLVWLLRCTGGNPQARVDAGQYAKEVADTSAEDILQIIEYLYGRKFIEYVEPLGFHHGETYIGRQSQSLEVTITQAGTDHANSLSVRKGCWSRNKDDFSVQLVVGILVAIVVAYLVYRWGWNH